MSYLVTIFIFNYELPVDMIVSFVLNWELILYVWVKHKLTCLKLYSEHEIYFPHISYFAIVSNTKK